MKKVGVEVTVRVFTEDWEMTAKVLSSVAWTAAGVAFGRPEFLLKFPEVLALAGERP